MNRLQPLKFLRKNILPLASIKPSSIVFTSTFVSYTLTTIQGFIQVPSFQRLSLKKSTLYLYLDLTILLLQSVKPLLTFREQLWTRRTSGNTTSQVLLFAVCTTARLSRLALENFVTRLPAISANLIVKVINCHLITVIKFVS